VSIPGLWVVRRVGAAEFKDDAVNAGIVVVEVEMNVTVDGAVISDVAHDVIEVDILRGFDDGPDLLVELVDCADACVLKRLDVRTVLDWRFGHRT